MKKVEGGGGAPSRDDMYRRIRISDRWILYVWSLPWSEVGGDEVGKFRK